MLQPSILLQQKLEVSLIEYSIHFFATRSTFTEDQKDFPFLYCHTAKFIVIFYFSFMGNMVWGRQSIKNF